MHRFKTGILVRDKRIEEMEREGIHVDYMILNDFEYIEALRNKIIEEAREVADEKNREKLIFELADLLEVFQALKNAIGISDLEIFDAQSKKKLKYGAFNCRYFTNFVEISDKNPAKEYYLQRPEKYPKI